MELRSCSNVHYMQAIKGGLVIKVPNIVHGKPDLITKNLKDIYGTEDVKGPPAPKLSSEERHEDSRVTSDAEQIEISCIPFVERKLESIDSKIATSGSDRCGDEECFDSDDNHDEKLTLKQLMERSRTKKRKHESPRTFKSKKFCSELPEEDDESDLKKPLSSWKLKLAKRLKSSKKSLNRHSSDPRKLTVAVKSEVILDCEDALQLNENLDSCTAVKIEVPEPHEGCETLSPYNFASIVHNKETKLGEVVPLYTPQTSEVRRQEPFSATEQQICTINESFLFVEDDEPIRSLPLNSKEMREAENAGQSSEQFLKSPARENKIVEHDNQEIPFLPGYGQDSDLCGITGSCLNVHEIEGQRNGISGLPYQDCRVHDTRADEDLCFRHTFCGPEEEAKEEFQSNRANDISKSSFAECSSYLNCHDSLCTSEDSVSTNDHETEAGKPSKDPFADTAILYSDHGNQLICPEHEVSLNNEKQISLSSDPLADFQEQSCNVFIPPSTSELQQVPERLFSTRKAIPPSEQEQLCLAMNSIGLCDDIEQYKCKEEIWKQKEEQDKEEQDSLRESSNNDDSACKDAEGSCKVTKEKIPTSPKPKPRKIKRRSPPNSNHDDPRISRSMPILGTGCASIEGCSESAIAFSQRQMRDMESLTLKLMNELRSMKDIVEGKLLFEAYRNVSLRNDADEVKIAVKNATKAEETAKKWLSIMSRDCTRFCKLMRMNHNGPLASKSAVSRERKKISFADEAGGVLCHVNYFEDSMTSETVTVKKEDQ